MHRNAPTLSKVAYILFVFCTATAIASPAQILTTLHSFYTQGDDGIAPYAGLIQAGDGSFYGTTNYGGANSDGTVFKITPSGALTTLASFCIYYDCPDGAYPAAGLVQASDGNFYGTTSGGGQWCLSFPGCGTVFKITPSGGLATLHRFAGSDGALPYAGLVQASDGNFYGTTYVGGANGGGTVFKITPSGTLTTLYSFCSQSNCSDGGYSNAGLVQASDGNFYGTTFEGGANGAGTVFKITPSGALITLHSFCSQSNCSDGTFPYAGLVQANGGNFYGTTGYGGAYGEGAVFKITPSGALTTLYSFCLQTNCSDGVSPRAGLIQASDGNFYGTTVGGGANDGGTAFKITPSGALTTLYSFGSQPDEGVSPYGGLIQASDGNFYGTTVGGGSDDYGTVFRLVTVRTCIFCP